MRSLSLAAGLIIAALIITLLIVGKTFLVPLFLAVVIWYLINAVNELVQETPAIGRFIPDWLGKTISAALILGFLYLISILVSDNIRQMIAVAPDYQNNFWAQMENIFHRFGMEMPDVDTLLADINIANILQQILGNLGGFVKGFVLVVIYVIFLLLEEKFFNRKLEELRLTSERSAKVTKILDHINEAARTYILVKTFTSVVTGILSYAVLYWVGIDFALFWGFLIFLLNYIPTFGSIIATAFPSLLALVQFDSLSPFLIVLFVVVGIQLLMGSFLEPRWMGDQLNISPLVVLLSLTLWGIIWGPVGMLLCVPITIILIIIFSQFPSTRPIAVLLSKDGKVLE
ncbi:MAG: AI-2E family transporter [Saprospiraceae bacterium]